MLNFGNNVQFPAYNNFMPGSVADQIMANNNQFLQGNSISGNNADQVSNDNNFMSGASADALMASNSQSLINNFMPGTVADSIMANNAGMGGFNTAASNPKVQTARNMAQSWINGVNPLNTPSNFVMPDGYQLERSQVAQTVNSKNLPINVGVLDPSKQGTTNGKAITLNNNYVNQANPTDIAGTILHEWHHNTFGSGTIQDEVEAENFAEVFRKANNSGNFGDYNDIVDWANRNYTLLA
jgi:hypothetical protein